LDYADDIVLLGTSATEQFAKEAKSVDFYISDDKSNVMVIGCPDEGVWSL